MESPPEAVLQGVRDAGVNVLAVAPIPGGVNLAARLDTADGAMFLKWSASSPEIYRQEADGLRLLAAKWTLRVPVVIAIGGAEAPFLLLEWIESLVEPGLDFGKRLGTGLARSHRASQTVSQYGSDTMNALGVQHYPNGWFDSCADFFRSRVEFEFDLAMRRNRISPCSGRKLVTILDRWDRWFADIEPVPTLIHGDFWRRNVLAASDGSVVVVDPALVIASREIDVAYLQLFDIAPEGFLEAYEAEWPLPDGFARRAELYRLYVHLSNVNFDYCGPQQVEACVQAIIANG